MNKKILLICVLLTSLTVFAQQIQEESLVINVEVPVRVFKSDKFVDNLSIDDFEVYEDGVLQKVEAVYLVKKKNVERREEKKRFAPVTSRNYYLFFEISDYTPKLGDAVEYFIQNVMYPDDNLTIITPLKTYRMKGRALELRSRKDIINELKGLIRKDALVGNSEYRATLKELETLAYILAARISGDENLQIVDDMGAEDYETQSLEENLVMYENMLSKLENLRSVDQQQLLNFAEYLKGNEGQKYIFMFYQKEFVPQIDPKIINQYLSMYQDSPNIQQKITGLFEFFRRDIPFNIDKVKKAYADSSVSIHFLFISAPVKRVYGIRLEEQSDDIFAAFREMSRATGGFIESSANPDYLFQKAVESSENYYLLYYSPMNYKSDGSFKEIKIRVKNRDYKIAHRLGYFAN